MGLKMMNKLLLVENTTLTSGTYFISYKEALNLNIKDDVTLAHYEEEGNNININLLNNAHLNLYYVYEIKKSSTITITTNNSNLLKAHFLLLNKGDNTLEIKLNMLGNSSEASLNLRVINENNSSSINVLCTGKIAASTIDNTLLEDLKGLLLNNSSIKISPNIEVDTNEVMANHLVTIGSFNTQELFYLKSKGLSEKEAKNMLLKAFLFNALPKELEEKINLEVINFE